MAKIGEINKLSVIASEWVDKDSVYLLNPRNCYILTGTGGFKPMSGGMRFKDYLKNLWKAIRYGL